MIPQKATLKNFHGIKAGLNRDEITLDLSGGNRVIAFKGDNGSGKSTIFNWGLTPWREPPGAGSVYDACYGPEALRELEFLHDSTLYRSSIIIRQTAKSRSMVASMFLENLDGQWSPMVLPDGTTSDGKSTTYDRMIEELLGPQELYFLAAFQGQGQDRISDYGDPKSLMGKLLRLGEIENDAARARDVGKEFRRGYDGLQSSLNRATILEMGIQEGTQRLAALEAGTAAMNGALDAADMAKAQKNDALQKSLATTGENDGLRRQLAGIEARKAFIPQERQRASAIKEAGQAATKRSKEQQSGDANRSITLLTQEIAKDQSMIADAEKTIGQLEIINRADAALPRLRAEITRLETLLNDHRAIQVQWREANHVFTILVGQVTTRQSDVRGLESQCALLREQAEFVDVVTCKGQFPFDDCPALISAINARDELPKREPIISDGRLMVQKLLADKDTSYEKARQIGDQTMAMDAVEKDLVKARQDLLTTERWATRRQEVASAIKGKSTAEEHIKYCDIEIANLSARLVAISQEADEKIKVIDTTFQASMDEIDARLHVINAEIAALPPLALEDALVVARQQYAAAVEAHRTASTNHTQHIQSIAAVKARISEAKNELAGMAAIREKAKLLEGDIAGWNLLATGLKGVIDLVIEDAGPTIASIANQLLSIAYGPQFSIRIVTQRELKNGNTVETFDLSVLDSLTGMEGPIARKSGGQRVWLNKALSDAVAIYFRQSSGIDYGCMFCDEVDDGLTEERKLMFYKMDRETMRMGGYSCRIFISHHQAAWEMADLVIDLDKMKG